MLSDLFDLLQTFLSECKLYDYVFLALLGVMAVINGVTQYRLYRLNKFVALTDKQLESGEKLEMINNIQWVIIDIILVLYVGLQCLVRYNVLGIGTTLN